MYLEIFLADFAIFRVFWGISQDFTEIPDFAGPRPREISEALKVASENSQHLGTLPLVSQPNLAGKPVVASPNVKKTIILLLFSQAIGKGKQIQLNTTDKNKEQLDCS